MAPNTTANAAITICREFLAKYGLPVHCVSDNGPQFRSEEFVYFLEMNGVKHIRVAPYHAASNGLAEQMVQSFKNQGRSAVGSATYWQLLTDIPVNQPSYHWKNTS